MTPQFSCDTPRPSLPLPAIRTQALHLPCLDVEAARYNAFAIPFLTAGEGGDGPPAMTKSAVLEKWARGHCGSCVFSTLKVPGYREQGGGATGRGRMGTIARGVRACILAISRLHIYTHMGTRCCLTPLLLGPLGRRARAVSLAMLAAIVWHASYENIWSEICLAFCWRSCASSSLPKR